MSAGCTRTQTLPNSRIPDTSVDDIKRVAFRLITKGGGFTGDLFKNPEGGIYYELYKKFVEPHGKQFMPPAFIDGLNQLVRKLRYVT